MREEIDHNRALKGRIMLFGHFTLCWWSQKLSIGRITFESCFK